MRRVGNWLVAAGLVIGATGGCSSAGGGEPAPPAGVSSPTTEPTAIVPDAEVTRGLADVSAAAAAVAAALGRGDQAAAKEEARRMYDRWYAFEATVRRNDKDRYLQMEDGLNDIQAGARDARAERVERGIRELSEGSAAYRERYP